MKKRLFDIHPCVTTHHIGQKYILLTNKDTNTDLTQIAVTQLKAGEVAEEHLHRRRVHRGHRDGVIRELERARYADGRRIARCDT